MNDLPITVIGSYPRPPNLAIPNWFEGEDMSNYRISQYNDYLKHRHPDQEATAVKSVIEEQVKLGIDIITDGEVTRENYIHYFCRRLVGFDFDHPDNIEIRNNRSRIEAPRIIKRLAHPGDRSILAPDWKRAPVDVDVKMTIPGPMTILDTVSDHYYHDHQAACADLANIINQEIKLLIKETGCRHVQIDEPVMARYPEISIKYGLKYLQQCFTDLPDCIFTTVHICCGYPNQLNQVDYPKAPPESYQQLLPVLDNIPEIKAVSIEDAHRHNDLSLFTNLRRIKVILGVLNTSSTRIESVEEIRTRIQQVLEHLPSRSQLIIAPDCGLGMLPHQICQSKIANMVSAVRQLRAKLI